MNADSAAVAPLAAEHDCTRILRDARPVIDVRAPCEFARGALPGAVNLPLLEDGERAAVGTAYRRHGRSAAIELGLRLVSGSVRQRRIDAWRTIAEERPDAVICCARGGLRSEIAQSWLARSGVALPRVAGGFKALRACCLSIIDRAAALRRFVLVGGRTGAGKTRVLASAPAALDLEALAGHRGSAFGALPMPQPTPIAFENALALTLLRLPEECAIAVEDESRTIGRLAIPEVLYSALQRAPVVLLEVPLAERIGNIRREYVEQAADPQPHLRAALDRIRRRLGGARHAEIAALMAAAFRAPGDAAGHDAWISRLLADYYDPMYDHQLRGKADRIAMRGGAAQVAAFLRGI